MPFVFEAISLKEPFPAFFVYFDFVYFYGMSYVSLGSYCKIIVKTAYICAKRSVYMRSSHTNSVRRIDVRCEKT
jgi:hypothetical protein